MGIFLTLVPLSVLAGPPALSSMVRHLFTLPAGPSQTLRADLSVAE